MGKRKKNSYPHGGDIVDDSEDLDEWTPFATVSATQSSGDEEIVQNIGEVGIQPTKAGTKRQKSAGTIKEKEFKKNKSYSNVVCRLQTICHNSRLCEEIRRTALAMRQIQLETWHLVNLHTLRCLENGLVLPDFADKTFFDHCCSGVSSTSQTHRIAQKNPELWQSILLYQS